MMSKSESALPHWDMSVVYPGLASAEFENGFQSAVRSIDQLVALFDQYDVVGREPFSVDSATVEAFETVIDRYNAVLAETHTLETYIACFVHTDSRNELAQAKLSELKQHTGQLSLLSTRFAAWIASLDLEALLELSPIARAHAFMLQKARQRAGYLMPPAEEALATEMCLTGSSAWTSLWNTFTSQLTITLEIDGKTQDLPMSSVRKLAYDSDRAVRRRAYEAELAAWERAAIPLVAALNGIKGEQNVLAKRRGWASPLDAALFENNIDRQALDALMEAVHEAFPDFRRYLRAKARILDLPVLAWYDLNAPVGESERMWSFDEARQFIIKQFGTYSPRLAGLAERAFQERWIDAEPRPGKMDVSGTIDLRNDESRIMVNYKPSFCEVSILAHELGHAYHILNLAQRTALQRTIPLTLAETASTFCQIVVQQAGLQRADAKEQITILDASLQMATFLLVEITTWFMFEQDLCEKRQRSELSLETLKQMMLGAQRQVYGDALDPNALHPYTWAAWPHLFWASFYNFQYPFGTLFGLGLYGRCRDDPEDFKARYDGLLSSTGMGEVADLTARFGIDISTLDFWRSSLDVIRADIDRFESAVGQQQMKNTGHRR